MSEENLQRKEDAEPEAVTHTIAAGYEIVFNKGTNEITLKDPSGNTATLKATVVEPEEEEDEIEPLTVEQFGDALRRIDALGVTWTADRTPRVKAKDSAREDALLSDAFFKIQEEYPSLPHELSIVVSYALTGSKALSAEVGGEEALAKKAEIVNELIITIDYRTEFFFKHALKVPYIANIDWEVVLKMQERNVRQMPAVSYALMTLTFHDDNAEIEKHRSITLAADMALINRVISTFNEIKLALETGRRVTENFHAEVKKAVSDAPATIE